MTRTSVTEPLRYATEFALCHLPLLELVYDGATPLPRAPSARADIGDKPLILPVDPADHATKEVHAKGATFDQMLVATRDLDPIPTAVVHPCDEASLEGALYAQQNGLITPILVGPETKIRAAAKAANLNIQGIEIVPSLHSHDSAKKAVCLVHEAKAQALMKGALHTDELMGEVVHKERGLRTERRMSHIFVLDVPTYPKPLLISDAAINIFPDLETKADIVQNAIELAQAIGVDTPKVAIPVGARDREPAHPLHGRSRRALQDGRPASDHWWHPRWPACLRQRGVQGSR